MYVTGMGRCSGAVHLAVQYPKMALCLCALGFTAWAEPDIAKVAVYCNEPTAAHYQMIRASIRPAADKVCFCLDGACGPGH